VYSPLLEITPTAVLPPVTPSTCQLTAVLAVNCCCPAAATMDEVGEIETEGCDWGCMGVPPPPQLHIPKMSDNTKLVGPVPTVNLVVDHDFVLAGASNPSLRAGPVVGSRKVFISPSFWKHRNGRPPTSVARLLKANRKHDSYNRHSAANHDRDLCSCA
jgi:hypothetical protein